MIHPLISVGLAACIAPAFAADAWLTNIGEACKQAAAQNKAVLIEFTGSDWCNPCMALRKNVTGTKEFENYASKNYILVEIDLAKFKKDPTGLYKQNWGLYEAYKVRGVPCILIMDPSGNITSRFGYHPNNESMKKTLENTFRKNREFHETLAAAERKTGDAKILELTKIYKSVPEDNRHNYQALFNRLVALDKNDLSGLVAETQKKLAIKAMRAPIEADLIGIKDPVLLESKIDQHLLRTDLPNDLRATLLTTKAQIRLFRAKTEQDIDNIQPLLDQALKIDPKLDKEINRTKDYIRGNKQQILEQNRRRNH